MSLPAERNLPAVEGLEPLPEAMSDNRIIQQVIAGDVGLFELILRRYNQHLFRVARSIIGDDAEAQDIV